MIKKILFSLLLTLTICITFVATKVSADTPNYELTPIATGSVIPYNTQIYYDNVPTMQYNFIVNGSGIAEGSIFVYRVSVDASSVWTITIVDDGFGLMGTKTFDSDSIVLESYDFIAPVAGDFTLVEIVDVSGATGNLCLKTEIVVPPGGNESNAIYNGVYELLADSLYGGTENLTDIQTGVLEWFSILITLTCLLLPFIIVFFVIKLLFK